MASAFTLFGELKADTSQFKSSLRDAESRLRGTMNTISDAERRAQRLGQTSATTARGFEKLRDKAGETQANLKRMGDAFQRGDITGKQMIATLQKTERATAALSSRVQDVNARLRDKAARAREAAAGLDTLAARSNRAGSALSALLPVSIAASITAGLTAIGRAAYQSAVDMDSLRNRMAAATGSMEAGNRKLAELRKLAMTTPGVMAKGAVELYAFFKPLGAGEKTVENLIRAFGRLKMANDEIDVKRMAINLTQLFTQAFERTDLKELVGAFPRAGELLKEAFQLSGSDLDTIAKEMKDRLAKGLSREQFLAGFAEAVNNDPSLSQLRETLGGRMEKIVDRMSVALEPLGQRIVSAVEPGLLTVAGALERIFGQASTSSTIAQFFVEAAAMVARGFTMLTQVAGEGAINLGFWLRGQLGMGDNAEWEKRLADFRAEIENYSVGIENELINFSNNMKEADEKYLKSIIDNPNASEALKQSAFKRWQAMQEGFKTGSDQAQTTIKSESDRLKTSLETLAKNTQISPALKKALGDELKKIGDTVKSGTDQIVPKLTASQAALKKAIEGLLKNPQISTGLREALQKELAGIGKAIEQQKPQIEKSATGLGSVFGLNLSEKITGLKSTVSDAATKTVTMPEVETAGKSQGQRIGTNIGEGLILGMNSRRDSVFSAGRGLGLAATSGISSTVQEQSPAKVQIETGRNIALGLVVGMTEGKKGVEITAAVLAKAVNEQFKELSKSAREAAVSVGAIFADFARFASMQNIIAGAEAAKQTVLDLIALRREMGVTGGAPAGVEDAAAQLANLKSIKDRVTELVDQIRQWTQVSKDAGDFYRLFSDPALGNELERQAKALGKTRQELQAIAAGKYAELLGKGSGAELNTKRDGPEGSGLFNEEAAKYIPDALDAMKVVPTDPWNNFFQTFFGGLARMRAELPSMKQVIGENLTSAIMGIGDVFANAVAYWDGTAKGFFKSIAQGFKQMAQQIIAELLRIAVMQAVLKLVGAFAGGGSAGGSNASLMGGLKGAAGFAAGGFTGYGNRNSPAGIVHRGEFVMPMEAVKKFGLGFMESIRSLQMPMGMMPAMAGGASNTYNNSRTNNFNINVAGGGSRADSQRTAYQVRAEIMKALMHDQERNK